MNNNHFHMFSAKTKITAHLLLFSLIMLNVFSVHLFAQRDPLSSRNEKGDPEQFRQMPMNDRGTPRNPKIAPDLAERSNEFARGLRGDENQKVIIQLDRGVAGDNVTENGYGTQSNDQEPTGEPTVTTVKEGILVADLGVLNGTTKRSFRKLGLVAAELPLSKIEALTRSSAVAYISPDRQISANGHLETTSGTAQIRSLVSGITLDGTGIGLAIIDSGIDSGHHLHSNNDSYHRGVVFSKDFTGGNVSNDPYGHGTHVAAVATGQNKSQSRFKNGYYFGIAPLAQVLNLRVLDSAGHGNASNVIAALDWAVANKAAYNIRVINLSLGTPARDSYRVDPLCLAARRAVSAGIVVVTSAGNNGKDAAGNKLYGTIGSPGIEPSVITVGAANTFGTDARSDDGVATYSSRGPTRGYVILSNGARKYDNLVKPDLVAPGNKIITAHSSNIDPVTSLTAQYPSLFINNGCGSSDEVMYMSGTSVAAPVVAGAVAVMLEANPSLTPNLVKTILMYSAQPLNGFNTLEQGAGLLNVDGAVRLARLVKTTLPTVNGSSILTGTLPASQTSVIAGETALWGKGVITNFGFLSGDDLMNKWQGMYANGVLVADSTPFSGSSIARSSTLTSGTLGLFQGAIKNNGVLVADGVMFLSSNAMGGSPTPHINSQGVLVCDGVLVADGVLVGDGVLVADSTADSVLGDNTAGMIPTP